MAGATKQPLTQDPDPQNISYWMGKVDATLSEMKDAINVLLARSEREWNEINGWRRQVEERLQTGNTKFDDHNRRLLHLEEVEQKAIEAAQEAAQAAANTQKATFGTWPWFRDKYLESFLIIVITIILYKVVEIVIAHWNLPIPK